MSCSFAAPFGVELEDVTSEYADNHSAEPVTVRKVVTEFLAIKKPAVGKRHYDDLEARLEKFFCDTFGTDMIGDVSRANISRWIDGLSGGKRTKRNYHSALISLFKFARERGYLPDDRRSAAERVTRPRADRPNSECYTAEELKKLIAASIELRGRGLLSLVLQAFTGIRSEEICRIDPKKDWLRWNDIFLEDGEPEIRIRPEVAKTDSERYVFVPACLKAWLRIFWQDSTQPIFPHRNLYNVYAQVAARAGIEWKRNGLRKAYNTFHEALSSSRAFTAGEAGSSAGMIRQFYRKSMPRVQSKARDWFSITPALFEDELVRAGLIKRAA